MSDPAYVIRLFDARRGSATTGQTLWLRNSAGGRRAFTRTRALAHRFPSRGLAERAVDVLPALYHPAIEQLPP